ncbi:hypothetical protein ACFO3J_01655 [Streptomyces polygonati]|uniref:Serine/threonine protein kinase n=1 Tax=Streptomyces polygonati TaxID=1617087 RepID=A0ABV8HDZ5_9ACTN
MPPTAPPTAGETAPPAEPEPAPEPAAAAPDGDSEAAPTVYKPRRRGRTARLIAVAAVLGVVAGGGVGYRIQQQRDPTPPPPLTGAMPAQPKGAGPAVPALPVSQDRAALYDGDLLKFLVQVPKSGEDPERLRVPLWDYAETFDKPAGAFEDMASDDFQQGARADWTDAHGVFREVDLTQFRDEASPSARARFSEWWADIDGYTWLGPSEQIAGVQNGSVWPSGEEWKKSGFQPEYRGHGLAEVGNILIEVFVDSPRPVKSSTVRTLIDQQLERL